ncbi:MAG TPA: 6-bladed beta-propeller [Thermoanaerobaculia bacterium]
MYEVATQRTRFLSALAFVVLLALGISGIVFFGGGTKGSFRNAAVKAPANWEDLAGSPRRLDLQYPNLADELMTLPYILVDSAGNLIVPHAAKGKLLVFDPTGKLVREIGRKGQGPGEFNLLSHAALDSGGRLVAYDADGRRFSVFSAGTYQYEGSFHAPSPVTEIASLQDGLALYSPYKEQVITKIGVDGKVIREALSADRERLRLFLCRFQNGGVVEDGEGGVFGIYPESFTIFRFDKNLNPVSRLNGGTAEWRPDSPVFPESLSPYGYTPAHLRWWDSHLHVDDIFNVSPNLIAVTLYKSNGPSSAGWYLNLYTKEGEILAEGLTVPQQGRIVAAKDCKLWVARDAYLKDDGTVVPFKLEEHSLKAGSESVAGFCAAPPVQVAAGRL